MAADSGRQRVPLGQAESGRQHAPLGPATQLCDQQYSRACPRADESARARVTGRRKRGGRKLGRAKAGERASEKDTERQ